MKFNLNALNTMSVKELCTLFVKAVIVLAIASVVLSLIEAVLPVAICLFIGFVIYRYFKLSSDKKEGLTAEESAKPEEDFDTGRVNLTK